MIQQYFLTYIGLLIKKELKPDRIRLNSNR